MILSSKAGFGALIASFLLLVVPLVVFPEQLGLPLAKASVLTILLEAAYYIVMTLLVNREIALGKAMTTAGFCLLYRYSLGVLFGCGVALFFSVGWSAAMKMGVFSYLPAVLIQTIAAPFVLRPLLNLNEPERRPAHAEPREVVTRDAAPGGLTSISVSREKGVYTEAPNRNQPEAEARRQFVQSHEPGSTGQPTEMNGFEKATRYIGEHGSVYLAAVVDNEGLLLSNFKRGSIESEDWAPLALLFFDANRRVLNRAARSLGTPDRLDIMLKETRLLLAREAMFSLMVVADRHCDETLQIRFNQAMEMVKRYVAERFGSGQESNAERIHVSNTQ